MYQNWTSQKLGGFVGWTKGKMGVGMLGSVIADYLPAWESVYFHSGLTKPSGPDEASLRAEDGSRGTCWNRD